MQIIDTHAHLDHLENLDQALENARQAGVEAIMCVSVDLNSNKRNREIKNSVQEPKIYLAMGMHPSEANLNDLENTLQYVREHRLELHAIGEIGLDFWYKWVRKDQQKKDEQREVFRRHLELAKEFDLPVIIHSRGAWKECLDTAKGVGVKKVVFHWYSGPVDVLKEILAEGYFVSTSPSLAFNPQSREAIQNAPIEQTLIETDSPVFFRGNSDDESFQAEPKDVVRTLKAYCKLKNIEQDKALSILNSNAKKFFNMN